MTDAERFERPERMIKTVLERNSTRWKRTWNREWRPSRTSEATARRPSTVSE